MSENAVPLVEAANALGASWQVELKPGLTIATDANGDGTERLWFDTEFNSASDYAVIVLPQGSSENVYYTAKQGNRVDIGVSGSSTTDGTVTVDVLVIGGVDAPL